MSFVVAALYHFVDLPDPESLVRPITVHCKRHHIVGTLLVGSEGVNGTIAGSQANIDLTLTYLRKIPGLATLEHKESHCEVAPFFRFKAKFRKEIVTMGVDGVRPAERSGQYVAPENWNGLISQEDVVLIDTRNDFEVRVGSFENAVNPHTTSFSEFPDYVSQNLSPEKNPRVAMYCTGGIRCEKATSYLLEQGFKEVYHLKGGILKYLEKVPESESKWRGECFVFDRRVSVGHGVEVGSFVLCHACQRPLSTEQQGHPLYELGISCEYCADAISPERRESLQMRLRQMKLASSRGENHLGMDKEHMRARRKLKAAARDEARLRDTILSTQ